MPRQNTCPADFPPFILAQIQRVAQHIVLTRKARGETQIQWADQLGISQPTMARIERGDPAIATATYVMCLWLVNPELNLFNLLRAPEAQAHTPPAPTLQLPASLPPSASSTADEFADLLASWNAPQR